MDRGGGAYPHNPTMRAISAVQRRRIATTLLDEASPVTEHDLADRLPTERANSMVTGAPNPDIRTERLGLVHRHLPVLADADLIDWNRDAATVERGSHPAFGDTRFRPLLTIDAENVDAVFSVLSHDHRRIALHVLRGAQTSVTATDLAREIRRRVPEVTGGRTASVDGILVSLHHVHLPKLSESDLIEYDPETDRATYAGHPALERVFSIIFAPEEKFTDKYDAFLDGLHDSYKTVSRGPSEAPAWPHNWRDPSRG